MLRGAFWPKEFITWRDVEEYQSKLTIFPSSHIEACLALCAAGHGENLSCEPLTGKDLCPSTALISATSNGVGDFTHKISQSPLTVYTAMS